MRVEFQKHLKILIDSFFDIDQKLITCRITIQILRLERKLDRNHQKDVGFC